MLGPRSRALLSSIQAPGLKSSLTWRRGFIKFWRLTRRLRRSYRSVPDETSHHTESEMSTWHAHLRPGRAVISFSILNVKNPFLFLLFTQPSFLSTRAFFKLPLHQKALSLHLFLPINHHTRYFPSTNLYHRILTHLTDCIV